MRLRLRSAPRMCGLAPPFSARVPTRSLARLRMNNDSRSWRQPRQKPEYVLARERHASHRRRKTRRSHMQENSAAATGHAGPRVVIDFDDQIVEAVGPRQAIAWFTGRPLERLVVAPIGWVFTPGVVRPDPPDRQQSARPWP